MHVCISSAFPKVILCDPNIYATTCLENNLKYENENIN